MTNTTLPTPAAEEVRPRRPIVAAVIGNAIEWYDFSVYAFFATYIAANFFVEGDTTQGLIATFMVFAVGFIARPIGSLVGGLIGDRAGRRSALMLSLVLMGAGMLVVAATPPVVAIGLLAPILLLVGRLLQGFAIGAEIGGAAAFIIEHAPEKKRSSQAAWLQASMGMANLLSAVIGLIITTAFPADTVTEWAWRIPFIFGLVIIPIGLYIRRSLPETPVFRAQVQRLSVRATLKHLFVDNWQNLLAGFVFAVPWHLSIYCFVVFGPTYYRIATGLAFPANESFAASIAGNICLVIGCVVSGRVADRVGRKRVLVVFALVLLVLPISALLLLHAVPTFPVLLIVHSLLCLNVSMLAGVAPSTLPMLFPPAVRATGMSISFNTAAIVAAAFTPALLTWAIGAVSVYSPAILAAVGALISLASITWIFRRLRRVPTTANDTDLSSQLTEV